jgi:hypothetical protein
MKLEGSCACGGVSFSLESRHPYPFNLCYCSICRKTAGGGGFAINLGGDAESLDVVGREYTGVYRARVHDAVTGEDALSPAERHFCRICATALWVWDPRWPELIHPFASAIDTELPVPPERTHLMIGSKNPWVIPAIAPGDRTFDDYPLESIAQWHQRLALET